MKKDESAGALHKLIEKYNAKIAELNEHTKDKGDIIYNVLKLRSSGHKLDDFINRGEIQMLLNKVLYEAKDIAKDVNNFQDWASSFTLSAPNLKSDVVECTNEIIKDTTVLHSYHDVVAKYEELVNIVADIQKKASLISLAISEEDYSIRADCCPTYGSILKSFFNLD